jgi:hypothetical protein
MAPAIMLSPSRRIFLAVPVGRIGSSARAGRTAAAAATPAIAASRPRRVHSGVEGMAT